MSADPLPEVCLSGKRGFPDETTARMAAGALARKSSRAGKGGKKPARPYQCRCCPQWHLTASTSRRRH